MNSRDLAYWLTGFFEIADPLNEGKQALSAEQVNMIRKHLALVFIHEIDPSYGDKVHQAKLNEVHAGVALSGGGTGIISEAALVSASSEVSGADLLDLPDKPSPYIQPSSYPGRLNDLRMRC